MMVSILSVCNPQAVFQVRFSVSASSSLKISDQSAHFTFEVQSKTEIIEPQETRVMAWA